MDMKLNDICEVYSGYALKEFNDETTGTPVIKIGNITVDGSLNLAECQYTAEKVKDKYYSKYGDIYIALSGATTGKIGIMDSNVSHIINQRVGIVRRKNNDIPEKYIMYFLFRQTERILQEASGCAQPNISPKQIAQYELQNNSTEEMKRITVVLDSISKVISQRKQELQKLDELIKARFVEMFGTVDNNRFGWVIKTIGDCCTLKSGTSLPAEIENEGGEIPYVKVGDMNYPGNERYITTSSRYVSKETAGKGIFPTGSIVFPKRGGAIGTNKKRMTVIPICADLNVMGVSSNGELLPEYLMAYFEMTDLGSLDNGSSVPQINNKDIAPLRICVPPLSAQKEYKDFVAQIDKSKVVVQKALDEAQLLFDSLMQKYFG